MIKIKKEIKLISMSAVFSALIVVFTLLGTFIDILDFTVAAICSFTVCIVVLEAKNKYAFMVYLASSALCLIFVPLSTATLYFVAFFGYYPILKLYVSKLPKVIQRIICIAVFNITMALIMLLFKVVFALQNEPYYIYLLLLAALNLFFLCFDRVFDIFPYLYIKKIRNKIKFML